MLPPRSHPVTAFEGARKLAAGPLADVALAVKRAGGGALIFDDANGRIIELDLRGSDADIVGRLPLDDAPAQPAPRGRGRPRLGVVAREVTLLPRHWEWLSAQPGGASVALRKLVEQARRDSAGEDSAREALEGAYRVMSALAGDLAGFEAAARALFAKDRQAFLTAAQPWPGDLRAYVATMAFG